MRDYAIILDMSPSNPEQPSLFSDVEKPEPVDFDPQRIGEEAAKGARPYDPNRRSLVQDELGGVPTSPDDEGSEPLSSSDEK